MTITPEPSSIGIELSHPGRTESGHVNSHDGYRLFYRRIGNGPDVTIIPLDLFLFDGLSSLARPHRTLIFYDPRNRGNSAQVKDLSKISVENDLHDLETIRDHNRVEKFNLIGYSVFGLQTAIYSAKHQSRVKRLVQLGPVSLKSGTHYPKEYDGTTDESAFNPEIRKVLQQLRETHFDETDPLRYSRLAWEYLEPGLVSTQEGLHRIHETVLRIRDLENEWPVNFRKHVEAHFGSIKKLSADWPWLRNNLTMPLLVIHGRKDRNAPFGAGREWASMLLNARLLAVENAAHQSWDDAPEIVLTAH